MRLLDERFDLNQAFVTYYVDAVAGDDTNDGSQTRPFRTIEKALDSVPMGGYGTIYLTPGQEFVIDADIGIIQKTIRLIGDDTSKPTIRFATYIEGTYNISRSLHVKGGTLILDRVIVQNDPKADSSLGWAVGGGGYVPINILVAGYNALGQVVLRGCVINQTRDYFFSTKHGLGSVTFSGCSINLSEDAVALCTNTFGTAAINVWNTTITSGYRWATGNIGQDVLTNLASLDT